MLKEKNKLIATLLAFAVIPMSGLATDIYLPSMPTMAIELQQPETKIQLTLTLFLISYGITQFFAGSVVDSFGRYRVTLVSLGLFMVSFLVTALTRDIMVICAMRILQGVLAGFAIVSKRAFFVDVFEGEQRKHYLSVMTTCGQSALSSRRSWEVICRNSSDGSRIFMSWRATVWCY